MRYSNFGWTQSPVIGDGSFQDCSRL